LENSANGNPLMLISIYPPYYVTEMEDLIKILFVFFVNIFSGTSDEQGEVC
jgi:hypothetical protein